MAESKQVPPAVVIQDGSDQEYDEAIAQQKEAFKSTTMDPPKDGKTADQGGATGGNGTDNSRKKRAYKQRAKTPTAIEAIAELPGMLQNMKELYDSLRYTGLLPRDDTRPSWPAKGQELGAIPKTGLGYTEFEPAARVSSFVDNEGRWHYRSNNNVVLPRREAATSQQVQPIGREQSSPPQAWRDRQYQARDTSDWESDENRGRQRNQRARQDTQAVAGWVRTLTQLNVTFSGGPAQDVDDFIDNVETSQRLLPNGVNLVDGIGLLLREGASTWFKSVQRNIRTWTELKVAMRRHFRDPDYQMALREEIAARVQGKDERISTYIDCMRGYFLRTDPAWSEREQVRYAHRGMKKGYKLAVPYYYDLTIDQMEEAAKRYEYMLMADAAKPLPKLPEASLCPGLAYKPQKSSRPTNRFSSLYMLRSSAEREQHEGVDDDEGQLSLEEELEELPDEIKALLPLKIREKAQQRLHNNPGWQKRRQYDGKAQGKCHRCGEEGHFKNECPNKTKVSCYGCGAPDTILPRCENCQGKGQEDAAARQQRPQ